MGNKSIKNIVITIVSCMMLMICSVTTALAQMETIDARVVYINGEPSYDKVETINYNFTDLSIKREGGFECAGFVEVPADGDMYHPTKQWKNGDRYIRIVYADDANILEIRKGTIGPYITLCEVWSNGRDYIKMSIKDFEKATGAEVEIQGNVYDTNGNIIEPEEAEVPNYMLNAVVISIIIIGIIVGVSILFIVKMRDK